MFIFDRCEFQTPSVEFVGCDLIIEVDICPVSCSGRIKFEFAGVLKACYFDGLKCVAIGILK